MIDIEEIARIISLLDNKACRREVAFNFAYELAMTKAETERFVRACLGLKEFAG